MRRVKPFSSKGRTTLLRIAELLNRPPEDFYRPTIDDAVIAERTNELLSIWQTQLSSSDQEILLRQARALAAKSNCSGN